jgi:hypothetical protein
MSESPAVALASRPGCESDAGSRSIGSSGRRDWALSAGVAAVAFAVYLLTLSRGVLGGDAGELQFVPPILGLTHPTGYPLQVLVHFAWSHLPIGTVAYRLNLLDALIAAGAVGAVVGLARAAGASSPSSALVGFALAFGELWWSQAVRGDKYTLNGLFLALVLLLFLRWRARPAPGRMALLAFVYGLSLTHHRSMLLVAPALGVGLLLSGWRPVPARALFAPALLCVAPLALYAYIPWAGARGLPPGSWPVDTSAAFVEFLLDRGYTSQIRPDAAFGGRVLEEARVLLRSFGPMGAVLGLTGAVIAFFRDWRLGLVLPLAFVPQAILGASYLLESNYQLPRHWVFFLPGFLIWSIWLGLGVDAVLGWLTRLLPRRPVVLATAIFAVVLLIQAGSAWARGAIMLVRSEAGAETMDAWRQDFQRSPIAERFGRLAMDLAAPDAIIVCDWEQATVLWYFQRVEGARPDLEIRYPIERLDQSLAEARATGRTVYITRTLPGVESRGVISSRGPLLQVYPPPPVGLPANALALPVAALPSSPLMLHGRFEGGLAIFAVDLHTSVLQQGSVFPFSLIWRPEAPLTEAYAISVRLVGPDGAVLAVHDERHPALGTSPTDRWTAGQVVGDYHELPIGSRLQAGTYQVHVIPYQVDTLQNLRRLDERGQPAEEGVRFPIEVGPRSITSPLDLLASLLAR